MTASMAVPTPTPPLGVDRAPGPAMTPLETRILDALRDAGTEGITCADLVTTIDGTFSQSRMATLQRYVATLRLLLKAEGRWSIRSSGMNRALRYVITDLEADDEVALDGEAWMQRQDPLLLRLHRRGTSAERIAEQLGYPNRNAVLARLKLLKNLPAPNVAGGADSPAPAQTPPAPPAVPIERCLRADRPLGITLAPCGYADWVYGDKGDQFVLPRGEAEYRVSTREDREVRQLNTLGARRLEKANNEERAS